MEYSVRVLVWLSDLWHRWTHLLLQTDFVIMSLLLRVGNCQKELWFEEQWRMARPDLQLLQCFFASVSILFFSFYESIDFKVNSWSLSYNKHRFWRNRNLYNNAKSCCNYKLTHSLTLIHHETNSSLWSSYFYVWIENTITSCTRVVVWSNHIFPNAEKLATKTTNGRIQNWNESRILTRFPKTPSGPTASRDFKFSQGWSSTKQAVSAQLRDR
jgi:hypothetical protein